MNLFPQLFTTIRIQNGKPILLQEHLNRLSSDYRKIHKKSLSINRNEIDRFLKEKSPLKGVWRLNIYTREGLEPKLTAEEPTAKKLSLKTYPLSFYEEYPQVKKEDFSKRLKLLQEAQQRGFDDYIFLDENGHILETCICNLFWIIEDKCYTPSWDLPLYFGVTVQKTLKALEKWGFEILPVRLADLEVLKKSYVFATNSMKEILPVAYLDQASLPQDNNLYRTILKRYHSSDFYLDALESTDLNNL